MVHPVIRRYLPYVNLTIATAALAFQTTVLYPWHEELDEGFRKLKAEQAQQLKAYHELKLRHLEELKNIVGRMNAATQSTQTGKSLLFLSLRGSRDANDNLHCDVSADAATASSP